MSLLYSNHGIRHYGAVPIPIHPRKRWAFQFIAEGETSLLLREEDGPVEKRLRGACLALTGPGCPHGWGGRPEDECRVLVFQFDAIAPPLDRIVGERGHRCIPVEPEALEHAGRIYQRCLQSGPKPHAELVYRIAGDELSLMVLEKLPPSEVRSSSEIASRKVESALAWYESNLHSGPTVEETARAVHVSPAHLRRLFHQILHGSPQEVFTRLQFERAILLLRDPGLTLETIAEATGFGSGSAFSRAFKAVFRRSPREMRTRLGDSLAEPGEIGMRTRARRRPYP